MRILLSLLRISLGICILFVLAGWVLFILGFWGIGSGFAVFYSLLTFPFVFFLLPIVGYLGNFIPFYTDPGSWFPAHLAVLTGAMGTSVLFSILFAIYHVLEAHHLESKNPWKQ
jgi:hypothetical protein